MSSFALEFLQLNVRIEKGHHLSNGYYQRTLQRRFAFAQMLISGDY